MVTYMSPGVVCLCISIIILQCVCACISACSWHSAHSSSDSSIRLSLPMQLQLIYTQWRTHCDPMTTSRSVGPRGPDHTSKSEERVQVASVRNLRDSRNRLTGKSWKGEHCWMWSRGVFKRGWHCRVPSQIQQQLQSKKPSGLNHECKAQ